MEILQPQLVWINGRCYRLLGNVESRNVHNSYSFIEDSYKMDDKSCEEEYSDMDIEIVPHGATQFKHIFYVPKSLFPHIIGAKHAVRKRLETETGTLIQIPKLGQDGDIAIVGTDREKIKIARHRIDLLIEAKRKRLPCTHFLAIPFNEEHIIMNFNEFKNDVLTNSGKTMRGVDETIFQLPSKLHLTIAVLVLLDDTERNRAIEALHYCKEHIIKPVIEKHGQMRICMQGVDIMNDDPTCVRVLYAKLMNQNQIVQNMLDEIAHHYLDIGLAYKIRNVKQHVTLMNTKFKLQHKTDTAQELLTFDATDIIKAHQNTFFGEITLKEIEILQCGTTSDTGHYQEIAKINLLDDVEH